MMKSPNEAVDIARHISYFLNTYAPSQLTNSEHTLKSYSLTLSIYIGFLENEKRIQPENLNCSCFERKVIEEWLIWLAGERTCSPGSCNNRLASLRVFLKYLGTRDVRFLYLSNSASQIPLRKTLKRKMEGLSRNAVTALLAAPNPQHKMERRDLAFMVLLYATATRLDEILSLKTRNLCLEKERPSITIMGKGHKMRTMYLLPKAVAHMKGYLEDFHGKSPDPEAFVFYSRNVGPHGRMTQAAIAKMLKKYAVKAHDNCPDVPLNLHAHLFRHAKASHWLEDGMNIVQISFLLGHEQLQTTMGYLKITAQQDASALATLQGENDKKAVPKWKDHDGTLSTFCGVKPMKGK